MTEHQINPAEALEAVRRTREQTARRGLVWWYAPVLGLGAGIMIASFALPFPTYFIGTFVGSGIMFANYLIWSRMTGLSVAGWMGPRTTAVAIALGVILLAGFVTNLSIRAQLGWREDAFSWTQIAVAAVVAVLTAGASWLWARAWVAEMRDAG